MENIDVGDNSCRIIRIEGTWVVPGNDIILHRNLILSQKRNYEPQDTRGTPNQL